MPNHRKPTNLLQLQGGYRPDRHGDRAGEVKPALGFPQPPEWLTTEARAEWDRLAADSAYAGAIAQIDRAMLAVYCTLWGKFVAGEIREDGPVRTHYPVKAAHIAVMVNLGAKLGLNPADRSRVKAPEAPKAANRWTALKGGHDSA
jgi:P27 family predicted phage terminase small subunit